MKKDKFKIWLIPLIIFLIALAIRLWGINAQGQTWDELAYYDGGKSYITNLYRLDFNSSNWRVNFEHPPVAKWIYGIAGIPTYKSAIFSDKFTPGRITSALMGALTILIVYFFVLELFKSKKTAIIAALILTFLPQFIAHNKVLGLETPSALFYTVAVYLFYLGLTKKPLNFIWAGIFSGLAVGTRFNNGHIFLLMVLASLVFYFIPWNNFKKPKFSYYILLIPVITVFLIWLLWPWLWGDTINHLEQNRAFLNMQLESQASGNAGDWFLGSKVIPPWYYFIYYFIATTPVLLLISLIIFLVQTIKTNNFAKVYLWLWFLTPFAMSLIGFKQDGIRYIFPVLVPLAIMCAYALVKLSKKPLCSFIFSTIIITYLIISCFLIHPHYLDYYSETVGGVKQVYAKKMFEVGWWGEGLDGGYDYIKQIYRSGKRILVLTQPDFSQKLGEEIDKTGIKQIDENLTDDFNFDYIITNPAFYWYRPLDKLEKIKIDDYEIIYEVKVASIPIVTIYQRK